MCGIVGFYNFRQSHIDAALRRIVHRGPDDQGVFSDGPVALGIRRLSIIDLAGSKQPIFNEDGRLALVFNGEIYNFQELRAGLIAKRHRFSTDGDTETIVHLYEEYGPACVHVLRGMFAFAIWDKAAQSLFIARDRLGIKPLYYFWDGRRFAFASEIKALRVAPGIGRAIDTVALDQYLALRYVPGPRTMYRDISKLQPGHSLLLKDGDLQIRRYWAPVVADGYANLSADDAAAELYRLLDEAVHQHMVADVPLGALLSGGIDSAAIVGLMSRHSSRPINTFTVGFHGVRTERGFAYDETSGARATAQYFGANHHELQLDASVGDLLPKLMWHFDEPVADPAALPTFLISQYARQSVTVAMSGEGADELLGGYPRYFWAAAAQRLQGLLPADASRLLLRGATSIAGKRGGRCRARLLLETMPPEERHALWTGGAGAARRRRLLNGDQGQASPYQVELGAGTAVNDLMRADLALWLVDDVLAKADKMSMAASLELRVPFLDHRVVEFATALPAALKSPVPTTKPLLRAAMGRLLPPAALTARKHAFAVPVGAWLRGDLRAMCSDLLLNSASGGDHGLLDRGAVRRLVEEHMAGTRSHPNVLWSLLCFETWYRDVFQQPQHGFSDVAAGEAQP